MSGPRVFRDSVGLEWEVFDVEQLERFLASIEHVRIPIIAGIWPLVSARNAEFLANEVPGVVVPEAVSSRMRRANEKSKEHAVAEGIAIAREMLERVRPAVQGAQVSAPFGKVELALEVFRDQGPGTGDHGPRVQVTQARPERVS